MQPGARQRLCLRRLTAGQQPDNGCVLPIVGHVNAAVPWWTAVRTEPPGDALPVGVAMPGGWVQGREAAATASGFRVWPDSFDVVVSLRSTPAGAPPAQPIFDPRNETDRSRVAAVQVVYSDGRIGASHHWPAVPVPYRTGTPVVTVSALYGQGDGAVEGRLHVWPLPPPGPLVFVIDWAAGGLAAARIEMDAGPLLAARERVVPVPAAGDHDRDA